MSDTLTITADSLNVRGGAGKDFPVVAQLPKGTKVQRLEQTGDWFRIQGAAGVTGWISASFAVVDRQAPPVQPTAPAATQLRVTATTLNLRAGPGADQALVKQLPNGMVVDRVEVSADGAWTHVRTPGGFEGWVSSKFVVSAATKDTNEPAAADPAWFSIAWNERGQKEHDGSGNNPRILEYQSACSFDPHDEEVPWCSSFANWVMKQAGIRGSGEASARSWLKWGQKLDTPRRGCIVVLSRPGAPTNGHVAFYVGEENGRFKLLGGNQENQVKVSLYDKSRLLSFRWPA
jgi:uncharacterized protein (TIGR02594 family)